MDLYLMQHGVAVPESEDPDRPLSVEGRSQIEASAVAMKKLRLSFDLIIATPRKRSRETAEIIAAAVGYPAESIMISDTLLPAAPPERALDALDQFESSHKIFIAGHLPALASLAACLLSTEGEIAIQFENGGLCCIVAESLQPGTGELVYSLTAEHLRLIAG